MYVIPRTRTNVYHMPQIYRHKRWLDCTIVFIYISQSIDLSFLYISLLTHSFIRVWKHITNLPKLHMILRKQDCKTERTKKTELKDNNSFFFYFAYISCMIYSDIKICDSSSFADQREQFLVSMTVVSNTISLYNVWIKRPMVSTMSNVTDTSYWYTHTTAVRQRWEQHTNTVW